MDNSQTQRVINTNSVFDSRFLDAKTLYLYSNDIIPNTYFISNIDAEKACNAFKEKFSALIINIYQYQWYKQKNKKFHFHRTMILLNNRCLLEFNNNYCDILHDGTQKAFVEEAGLVIYKFRERKKRQPAEINIIVKGNGYLDLKEMDIKRTKLDLNLFYEDDFKAVDETIMGRLNKKNDKGIVLLHGLPGTGKTTYLRYLVGRLKKRVLFLSPNVAGNLMDPGFLDLLIDNPNTVLIIEDAENIIMDRRNSNDSSVSNLLNISDGLMADFLNVQIICTFNSALTLIDSALMRKGRLIARYEFGKLSIEKAQKLSGHFKHNTTITSPMTVAEISNQHEQNYEAKQVNVIGFRREPLEELVVNNN